METKVLDEESLLLHPVKKIEILVIYRFNDFVSRC
jgi:hypothetical protein